MDSNGRMYTISRQQDWDLHRKGELDQQRHAEKIKDALKKNLKDIISDESIIMGDGKKTVRVPIKGIDEYHFRHEWEKKPRGGTTGNGTPKKGQTIGKQDKAQGQGKEAGDSPGEGYYEVEVAFEDLAALMFEDLGLPNLDPKKQPELTAESIHFNDIRKKGIMSNVDKKRTIIEAMKRNARTGRPAMEIHREDLRFKTWTTKEEPKANAVIIAMMDTSGSMGEFERYIARAFYFWMMRFLETKYQNVRIVFISHDTKAVEVDEKDFFTRVEGGGTMVSSAYAMALDIINKRFHPQDWNIYAFHFSDGDNWSGDNARCLDLMKELIKVCSMVGYGEIHEGDEFGMPTQVRAQQVDYYTLVKDFQKLIADNFINVVIGRKQDVYPALQAFFKLREGQSR